MNESPHGTFACPQCGKDVALIGCRTLKCLNTGCRWTRLLPIIKKPGTSIDALLCRAAVCIHRGFRRELLEIIGKLGELARRGEDEKA